MDSLLFHRGRHSHLQVFIITTIGHTEALCNSEQQDTPAHTPSLLKWKTKWGGRHFSLEILKKKCLKSSRQKKKTQQISESKLKQILLVWPLRSAWLEKGGLFWSKYSFQISSKCEVLKVYPQMFNCLNTKFRTPDHIFFWYISKGKSGH